MQEKENTIITLLHANSPVLEVETLTIFKIAFVFLYSIICKAFPNIEVRQNLRPVG